MPHIKKTLTMFLVSALLGGWAWYLNTTGTIGGISSSVLDSTTTFSCTEQSLKSYAATYRKISTRQKKAVAIKKKLEAEIALLKTSDPNNKLQKKEEALKLLTRQINTYLRFIKKYDTCKKEIKLSPNVSIGVMSWEAKVEISQKEYQALAAFMISSPNGLNTYMQSIQFKIDILPDLWIMVDKWYLLHEWANPILCQTSSDTQIIDCELSGDMPVDIMSGMSRTYWVAAHITAMNGSGTVDIHLSKISFNESREYSAGHIELPLLSFGVAPIIEVTTVPETVDRPAIQPEKKPETTTTVDTNVENGVVSQEDSTLDTTNTTSEATEVTTETTTETSASTQDTVVVEQQVTDTTETTVQDTSGESTSGVSTTDAVDTTSGSSESATSSDTSPVETSGTSSDTPAVQQSEEVVPAPSSETL